MDIDIEKFSIKGKDKLRLVNINQWRDIISIIKANDKKTDYEYLGTTRKRYLLRKAVFDILPQEFLFLGDIEFLETGEIPINNVISQDFLLGFKQSLIKVKILYDKFGREGLSPSNVEKILGGKKWK